MYDIVYVSELKHSYPLSIPGYTSIRSKVVTGEEHRGGVAIFFKLNIWPDVYNIRVEQDQIWFQICAIPDTKFGAIYIAPRDSPFFNPQSFALIQEHCQKEKVVMIGDFNSRMGNLTTLNRHQDGITYTENPDTGKYKWKRTNLNV